jgi:hypothetical protein
MNDIRVFSIQTYETQILHDYYYQIVTHSICDAYDKYNCMEVATFTHTCSNQVK